MKAVPIAIENLVIGGGPAGSMAAMRLARAGCEVVLLEKEFGSGSGSAREVAVIRVAGYRRFLFAALAFVFSPGKCEVGIGAMSGPMRRTRLSRIAYLMVRGFTGFVIPVSGSIDTSCEPDIRKLNAGSVPLFDGSFQTFTGRNPWMGWMRKAVS